MRAIIGGLKNWLAAAMQSREKVPRASWVVERVPGGVHVGSGVSFNEAGASRGIAASAERGFAMQKLL